MNPFDKYKQPMTPVAPQQQPGEDQGSDFVRGLGAGWEETKAMGSGLAMLAGDLIGSEGLSEWGEEGYREGMASAGEYAPPEQASKIEDIDSVGEFFDWGQYQLGKLMPMVATSLVSGGVGGIAAKGLAGAGLKGTAQIAARKAAQGQVLKGAEKVALKKMGTRATVGAGVGTAASSIGMETGLIAGDIKERTGESDPMTALMYGSAAGLLDVLPQFRILNKLGLGEVAEQGAKKLTRGQLARKVGKEIGIQAGVEGATEAGQEVLEEAAVWDSLGEDLTSPEALKNIFDKSRLMNAAAVGALGGGILGGGTKAFTELGKQGQIAKQEQAKRELTGEGQVFSGQEGGTEEEQIKARTKAAMEEAGLESKLTPYQKEELEAKLEVIRDEQDMQEDYGISSKEVEELIGAVRNGDAIPQQRLDMLITEMENSVTNMEDMANGNPAARGELRKLRDGIKRLEGMKEAGLESRAPGFYSAVEKGAKNLKQKKGTAEQMLNMLRKEKNVKQDEVSAIGLEEWMRMEEDREGTVSKERMEEFVKEGGVQVEEKLLGRTEYIAYDQIAAAEEILEAHGFRYLPAEPHEEDDSIYFMDEQHGDMVTAQDIAGYDELPREVGEAALNLTEGYAPEGTTEYADWQMEGEKEGYKELLLRLPEKQEDKADQALYAARNTEAFRKFSVPYGGLNVNQVREVDETLSFMGHDTSKKYQEPKRGFTGEHFQDTSNILAHVRFNERNVEGKKTLFIEEFQSDWAQGGREKGFKQDTKPVTQEDMEAKGFKVDEIVQKRYSDGKVFTSYVIRDELGGGITSNHATPEEAWANAIQYQQVRDGRAQPEQVPSAPFISTTKKASFAKKKDAEGKPIYEVYYGKEDGKLKLEETVDTRAEARNRIKELNAKGELQDNTEGWSMLAMKRMIKYASDNGYEQIAWTPGEVQNKRYSLTDKIDNINYYQNEEGTYRLVAIKEGTAILNKQNVLEKELAGIVGQELAKKITQGKGQEKSAGGYFAENYKELTSLDLDIGGEGMKGFYDKMLPSNVRKYLKSQGYDSKIGVSKVEAGTEDVQAQNNFVLREGQDPAEHGFVEVLPGDILPLAMARRHGHSIAFPGPDNTWVADVIPARRDNAYRERVLEKGRVFKPLQEDKMQEVWSFPLSPETAQKVQAEGAPLFSEKQDNAQGKGPVWDALKDSLGQRPLKRAVDAGIVNVLSKEEFETRFKRNPSEVQGLFQNGKVYVHEGTLNPSAVILHEGTHSSVDGKQGEAGLQLLLGTSYMPLQRQFDRLVKDGDSVAVEAASRARKGRIAQEKRNPDFTPDKLAHIELQERLAYYTELSAEANTPLFKRIVAQVKAWIRQSDFGKQLAKHGISFKLDNATIVELAKMSMGRTTAVEEFKNKVTEEGVAEIAKRKAKSKGQQEEGLESRIQQETPQFKKWFKDSKVVDDNGKPLRVYRGIRGEPTEGHGRQWHSTNTEHVKQYAHGRDANTMPDYLRIEKPFDFGFRLIETPVHLKELKTRAKTQIMWDYKSNGVSKEDARDAVDMIDDIGGFNAFNPEEPLSDENNLANAFEHFNLNEDAFVTALTLAGYDGIKSRERSNLMEAESVETFLPFTNDQIKSAVGNKGDFKEGGTALESFAGVLAKKTSQPLFDYTVAEKLLNRGEAADEVRKATGWFKLQDNKWRFEIPDNEAKLRLDKIKKNDPTQLGAILTHNKLFAAYPALRGYNFELADLGTTKNGSFRSATNTIEVNSQLDNNEILSTLLHEIQHGIQHIEGFAEGGHPKMFTQQIPRNKETRDLINAMNVAGRNYKLDESISKQYDEPWDFREAHTPLNPNNFVTRKEWERLASLGIKVEEDQTWNEVWDELSGDAVVAIEDDHSATPQGQYEKLLGETEAREVQDRQYMDTKSRRMLKPSMLGNPKDDYLIKMGGRIVEERKGEEKKTRVEEKASSTSLESFIGEIEEDKLTTEIKEMGESKRFNVEQTGKFDTKAEFTISPSETKKLEFVMGSIFTDTEGNVSTNSPLYYDPILTEIKKSTSTDEYGTFKRQVPLLKEGTGLVDRIPSKKRDGIIWRGMSSDEYEGIQENGFIKSRGLWNIGPEQAQTTSFGVDPRTAEFYANGFAPAQFKAMPGYNAYIVGIKDPGTSLEIAGNNEKDIPGKISAEDIVEVWEGIPYAVRPGTYETIREPWDKEFTSGSSNGITSMVGWKQIRGEEDALESRAQTEESPAFHDFSKAQLKSWSSEFEKQGIYVTRIKPEDFIKLTSPKGTYERIMSGELPSISEVNPEGKVQDKFDPKETDRNIRAAAPLLQIDAEGNIKEHEGRHRAAMLMRDGATSMAVVIRPDVYVKANEIWGAKNWVKDKDELPPAELKPQIFGDGSPAVGSPVKIAEGKILGYESTEADFDEALKYVGEESEQALPSNQASPLESLFADDSTDVWGETIPGFAGETASKQDKFLYRFQDRLRYLYTKQKKVLEAKGERQLPDEQDAYLQETLYHGRVKTRLENFHTNTRDPMLNLIKKMGRKIDGKNGIDRWLLARHAEEANERLRRINAKKYLREILPKLPQDQRRRINTEISALKQRIKDGQAQGNVPAVGPAMSAFDRSEGYETILNNELGRMPEQFRHSWKRFTLHPSGMKDSTAREILRKNAGDQRLQEIGRMFDAMNRQSLKNRHDAGLMTDEEYDAIAGAYQHWAPLKREGFEDKLGSKGQGYAIAGNEFMVRAGSTSHVVDVLANAIAANELGVIRAEKQKIGEALYNMVKANPDPSFWRVNKEDEVPTVDADGSIRTYKSERNEAYEVRVKIKGKRHRIRFEPTNENAYRIAHGLKNLDNSGGAIVGGLSAVNRVLSFVNTSASPEFMVSNLIRDLQTAQFNMSDTEAGQFRGRILKDVLGAGLGIRSALRSRNASGDWVDWYKDFAKEGGTTGWVDNYNSIEHVRTKLNRQISRMKTGSPLNVFSNVVDAISDYNTAVENAVRLATYKNLVDSGTMTKQRAAQVAKELTVNFNRKGASGQLVNALYLFANAGIQGSMRIFRAARYSNKVRAMMVGTIGASVGLAAANRELGGDDEDGENYYDKIPEWVKERNMIFMIPDSKGDYVKVPLPWGYNVLWVMGDQIAAAGGGFTGENPEYKAMDSASTIVKAMLGAFSPVQGGTLLQSISPTIADPVAMWAENKTFTGANLQPTKNPFDKVPTPAHQNFFKTARPTSQKISKFMSDISFGDDVEGGFVDVSPEVLDLAWDTVLGSAGRFLADTSNLGVQTAQGDLEDVEAKRTPFLRRVYGAANNSVDQQLYKERVTEIYTAEKKKELSRGQADYGEVVQETRGLLRLKGKVKATEKRIKQLRKLKRSARTEERKEAIQKRMERLMSKFNLQYRRMLAQGLL